MKRKITLYCLSGMFLLFLLISLSFADELPIPTYANSVIISIEHSPADFAEVDYIKSHVNFGLYAWLSFSRTTINPELPWHYDWNDASAGIQSFKDQVNALIAACREKNVRLHIVICSGIARALPIYREAKEEDIRNCSWYNDNKLASDTQILNSNVLDRYVFGTFSRYARKMRANLEAKAGATVAFLKQQMDENPDTLIAISGWGEAEMNFGRLNDSVSLQEFFCDYSPFAVLEFRDWICHTGMYDDVAGKYKGEGYAQGGAKYQGSSGLARFNADFGTTFTTWNLKYYNWSLADDYDSDPVDFANPDPNRIPYASYSHGDMMPSSGGGYIAGGFDPPRSMMTPSAFLNLWNLFRETMVHNFVKDMAKWASSAGIPADKWYSHQIPGDYLFGTNPSTPNKNGRYYSGASPLWTANNLPYGSAGATIYDIKFPTWFARTTEYGAPAIAAMSANWAIMEYDAETYPVGFSVPQSSVDFILNQYLNIYNYSAHLINFFRWWDDSGEHRIKGMNKEEALRQFVAKIRDKARRKNLTYVFDPPKVIGLSGGFDAPSGAIQISLSGKIWDGHAWEWKDWGDFLHFEIFRSTDPNFPADAAHRIATTSSASYADSNVSYGKAYFYKVKAVNSNNVAGPASDEIMVLPTTIAVPVLSVNKKSLSFKACEGGSAPWPEQVSVTNLGAGGTTIDWQASDNRVWVEVSPASGTGNATLNISINPAGVAAGTHTGEVTVTDPNAYNSPQVVSISLTVLPAQQNQPPFGAFDTPAAGSTVSGSVAVTGWALDDIGVKRVEIKREPDPDDPTGAIGSDGLVYIGDAVFVRGSRTDVEALYSSYPHNDKAGWGYLMLTYGLPRKGNGTFRLYAIAEDLGGKKTLLGTKLITSDNAHRVKPFGTIDTPDQGAVVSGAAYVNFGWALTPPPNMIPVDGSTIWVSIDSVFLGHPLYNLYRVDVASAFPECLNSNGAVGAYYIDTTKYTNGVHNIGWLVTDNAGNVDGMGSRFFEIQNIGGEVTGLGGVGPFNYSEDTSGALKIDVLGPTEIVIEQLGRVEIVLTGEGGDRFMGWGADKSKSLPVGSTLDKEAGIFYWMPAPGFLGKHILHFSVTGGVRMSRSVEVTVTVVPKEYNKIHPGKKINLRK